MAGRHTARHLRKAHRHARPAIIAGRARLASAGGPWIEAVPAGPWPRAATAGPWTGATAGHAPPASAAGHARSATAAGPWAPRLIGVARFASLVYVFALVFLALSAVTPAAVAGWQPLSVVSGSMQPAIAPGSLVMVQPADPDRYHAHPSILAFADPDRPGQLLTHRVVDTAKVDGVVVYTTKGDANRVDDSGRVPHGDVVGAVRMVIPFVGLPGMWVHNGNLATLGLWLLVSVLAVSALFVRARP